MPKSLVPAKKRPAPTSRPTRSTSSPSFAAKNSKIRPLLTPGDAKTAGKPQVKKAPASKTDKDKVKKPNLPKKEQKEKPKKVVVKKVIAKVPSKKPVTGKCKKKPSPKPSKKSDKAVKSEKPNVKREKDEENSAKEPVEVVIHVKKEKPKAKPAPKNEPISGKVKKNKPTIKSSRMKKKILKKLSGKMDEKLESVVNKILEVAVVKKVQAPAKVKTPSEESSKDKKKPKEPVKKNKGPTKETKDVIPDTLKTVIKQEVVDQAENPIPEKEISKESIIVVKTNSKTEKPNIKFNIKELNDEDIRKMEIKKEIIDEFIEEEEKQSKVKLERKTLPFLKKPKARVREISRKEGGPSSGKLSEISSESLEKAVHDKNKGEQLDSVKPPDGSSEVENSAKKQESLVKRKPNVKATKGKKSVAQSEESEEDEKAPSTEGGLDDVMDEEQKAKRMKLYGFWAGPKRHRVASLNAIAKVHCLYDNESRGAMLEMLDNSAAKVRVDKKKVVKSGQKQGKCSDDDEKKDSDDSVPEIPKRCLRTTPGMRSVGRHYDLETSSSSALSSSSSEVESEDEKPEKRPPPPKPETKVTKPIPKSIAKVIKKEEEEKDKDEEESPKEDTGKKVRKRRRRCELMMDLKDMVVRKRMASLNASAMLAATYSVEKKTPKGDGDKRKKSALSSTTDSTQSSTEVEPESSDDEVILSGTSKKVAVIVNEDTDVTITGLYVNSTTRSTRHCITGMQYRISSTSHTQTESAAVTTETVIHTSDHVSVSHSSSSSVDAAGSPSGSSKSYTPLGALSSMQPPDNSSPLMRRHTCSSSAFAPPPSYHHHQDIHGYYQPAGPLISHYHAASSSTSSLPAVIGPPATIKGSPSPEQQQQTQPPAEPPPPQEYRPPPFSTAGYPPPPPHHNYYHPYLQAPYHQDCYPYLKYPAHHPGYRRGYWPGHGPPGPGASSSGGPMVSSDPYHGGPPPGPGGPIEPYPPPHAVAQPPQPYPSHYYTAPPTCYTHPAPLRAPLFMPESSYQPCPCPTMSTFPKNVHTGPLTGASKGSVQPQAQNSQMSGQPTTGLSSGCGDQQQQQQAQQQGLSVPAATQPASSMPNVALALSLETNNPHHGPPSPARGSAGLPPPASPALSTARNPPSWSPPNIIPEIPEPTKETQTREETRTAVTRNDVTRTPVTRNDVTRTTVTRSDVTRTGDPSPPPLTVVAEGPPVLENQVVAAQRRPRPPKRKPSIERQVSPVAEERTADDQPPALEPSVTAVAPKRRRSLTPVRSKSEPAKVGTRAAKKPVEAPKPDKKPKVDQSEPQVTNGVAKVTPKIMDGAKKVNGVVQKPAPLLKNGICKNAKAPVQKMLLKNTSKAQSPPLAPKAVVPKNKKDNCKAKGIKCEPKRCGKKVICKEFALPNPTRTHPNGLKWSNGWSWEGEGFKARVFLAGDASPVFRRCYPAMRHIEGDIIYPMDCILLKSGPRKQQLPFIAKVASLWENPDDGEMMISLLWYYRPEHTDQGRQPLQPEDEVFASRHRDTNSVACIEDKCYVLTYNEYCRYKKSLSAADFGVATDKRRVVPPAEYYPRSRRLPTGRIANELLFFCRKVYDFRTKRLLKKPY